MGLRGAAPTLFSESGPTKASHTMLNATMSVSKNYMYAIVILATLKSPQLTSDQTPKNLLDFIRCNLHRI